MNLLELSLKIALEAHAGQTDRGGEPHILHSIAVGMAGITDEERCTGFLHDVLEDTHTTAEDLLQQGIPQGIVEALKLLCHDKAVAYMDYVRAIIASQNPIAMKVKLYDLRHNFERGKDYPDLQAKHGEALRLVEEAVAEIDRVEKYDFDALKDRGNEVAVFAAGCFWGVQHYFERMKGVVRTLVGYCGGEEEKPTYEDVRRHKTHHLEAVLVEYDPIEVEYADLCKLFFEIHDPAQTDGQGPDLGAQYLSGLFYADDSQRSVAQELIAILRDKGYVVNSREVMLTDFWVAEKWHQHYYAHTGGSPYCHIRTRKF